MKQHINFDDLLDSGVQPTKNRLARTRTHRVLFDADLPFRGRAKQEITK